MDARAIIDILENHVTDERQQTLKSVIERRFKGVSVVMENLYDPGNRSAVYRSAEAHGLMDVRIVRPEMATKSQARQVSRGAEKWLQIRRYENTASVVRELKDDGFYIAASDLNAAQPLHTLDFARPIALVFGNEKFGITEEMRELADTRFIIPMHGFAQSFNISVAAALTVSHARRARERAIGANTDLNAVEREALYAQYLYRSVKTAGRILRRSGYDGALPEAFVR